MGICYTLIKPDLHEMFELDKGSWEKIKFTRPILFSRSLLTERYYE